MASWQDPERDEERFYDEDGRDALAAWDRLAEQGPVAEDDDVPPIPVDEGPTGLAAFYSMRFR